MIWLFSLFFSFSSFSLLIRMYRSSSVERRSRYLLVELGYEGIFTGVWKYWSILENARTWYGCAGPWRIFSEGSTIHRWYSLGTFRNFTKRYVHTTHWLDFTQIQKKIVWLGGHNLTKALKMDFNWNMRFGRRCGCFLSSHFIRSLN